MQNRTRRHTCEISLHRRVRSFSEAQGCEGNRKPQTQAPWEREDCIQAARHPLLEEAAPGRKKGERVSGRRRVSSHFREDLFTLLHHMTP